MDKIKAGWSPVFCILLSGSLYSAGSRSITNEDWVEMGQAQGIQSWEEWVYTLALDSNGNLFAGGGFYGAGGVAVKSAARWDGIKWNPMGDDSLDIFYAAPFYFDKKGSLYAGVRYGSSSALNDLARWDGNRWTLLKTGIGSAVNDNGIHAIVSDNAGNIYIGGEFDSVGGIAVRNIAKWDGDKWSALGSGTGNGAVRTLCFDASGNLYAGGSFTSTGGIDASRIARWDGSAWHPLGTGASNQVRSIVIDKDGALYAGGWFDTAGGVAAHHVARWNGIEWSALENGVRGPGYPAISVLAFDNAGTLYAGGRFDSAGAVAACNLAVWDGSAWHALGNTIKHDGGGYHNFDIDALAFGGDGKVYAAGCFNIIGETAADNVALWDGSAWTALGQSNGKGLNGYVYSCAADNNGTIYAQGLFTTAGPKRLNYIGKWNGTDWDPLGKGILGSWEYFGGSAVAIGADGAVYAGGQFDSAGGVYARDIAQWNGSEWKALGSGIAGRVYAIVIDSNGICYAGGDFHTTGGNAFNNIAEWNGAAWNPLGNGINYSGASGAVYALAIGKDGALYVGGQFTTAGSVTARNIAKWEGYEWSALGSGCNGAAVYALAIDGEGTVYAGGSFDTAGGVPAHDVAKWDGSSWSAVGNGISDRYGEVYTLALDRNDMLYAGGSFDTINGTIARNVARWDGNEWRALGSGVDGMVHALSIDGRGDLFAGGRFTTAGGKTSPRFALCRTGGTRAVAPAGRKAARILIGDPVRGLIHTCFDAPTVMHIGIYSISGREIMRRSPLVPAGNHTVGIIPPQLARGVYIAQAKSGSVVRWWRVVVEQ